MKILITGAKGQLGYHLQQVFADDELFLGDIDNYDITKPEIILPATEQFKPDLIIHGAAYTNVDGAEANKELCYAINVTGSENVAKAAQAVGAKVLAISTDYVFAGDKGTPYLETDSPNPISYYGKTKYEGEMALLEIVKESYICRTSWLYGGPKPTPTTDFANTGAIKNFVYTMLRVGKDKHQLEVVGDQQGGPTYAEDLALKVKEIITTDRYGIYHTTNSGITNWAAFAQTIFDLAGYNTKVKPISSQEYADKNPQSTRRPSYSVLGHQGLKEAGLADLRSWQEAISHFMAEFSNHPDFHQPEDDESINPPAGGSS